jgi:NADH:ubiquinone oxidoreductase subunit F (NADH-binding)/(2Fe-2S) ferredoxin/NAD-dependent dihydropyrimidine dehydrogenase PreA subunit
MKVKEMRRLKNLSELIQLKERLKRERADNKKKIITICSGTGCHAYGCEELTEAFKKEINKQKISDKVEVRTTGCHGFCERGPIVVIQPDGLFYQRASIKDVEEIISETILNNHIIERLIYTDPTSEEKIPLEKNVPFYKRQMRLVFGKNGLIDPTKIEDYIAIEGYSALTKVLKEFTPEQVIEEIKKAGLRGRGGAGFPTGWKWATCRASKGDTKYIICNADEGDPGAYMDRSVLEGNPHSIIEGMLIGAYAIGAKEGYIYVRKEYPLAVKNVTIALEQAHEYGLLGENILETGFDFDINISRGAGAFVCGEETTLIASIEGRYPEPSQRPPYPAEKGLWGKPTNINNVETWANVPLIIQKGADWYSSIGTEKSKGTKIFSLVGKINNTGLVEVPMGITMREIIYDIGGGIPGGKEFKAVQTGGPSGGCIPKEKLDLPIDFESLAEAGSMMGSGGMIVMDENTCMVDIARYFLNFLVDESCGKCVPCREGIRRMLQILNNITKGEGKEEDIALLKELATTIKKASLCGLGQTAPNPVLSTLRYFYNEYEAHIKDKKCPAGVCKALIKYTIDEEKCTGCTRCAKVCPQEAVSGEVKLPHTIDENKCIKCGACYEVCNFDAIIRI